MNLWRWEHFNLKINKSIDGKENNHIYLIHEGEKAVFHFNWTTDVKSSKEKIFNLNNSGKYFVIDFFKNITTALKKNYLVLLLIWLRCSSSSQVDRIGIN